MKIYISGPMSGLPEFNYPAFNEAARILRANGYRVYNPAELQGLSEEKLQRMTKFEIWVWYMKRAIRLELKADTIVMLSGWRKSKGAKVERWLAKILGYEILEFEGLGVVW